MLKRLIILLIFINIKAFCEEDIQIFNLGKIVNSKSIDYAPAISPDGKTLYFVSVRPGSKLNSNGEPSHDFWVVTKKDKYDILFDLPVNLDTTQSPNSLNSNLNEGTASFSPDGKTVYFAACDKIDSYGNCDIYLSQMTDNGWSKPRNLGHNINSNSWESQPSISPDGTRLYFASDRSGPNGYQNMDIWFSDWDDELDEWGEAINLKQLNTSGRECSPFIAADNTTFFFSSDGYSPNLGGTDFYISRFDPEFLSWSKPAHLDAPLNTNEDDQFLSVNVSGDVLYFASKREDIKDYSGDYDLFMAFIPSMFKALVLKVSVNDEFTGENIASTVTVLNPITGKKVKEKLGKVRKDLEMIISNKDFGNPKDSIRHVDLEIFAENEKKEQTKKTLRVQNPEFPDADDLRELSDKIGVTLEFAQAIPPGAKERKESEFTIMTANAKTVGFDGETEYQFDTLKIEQNASISMHPMLNYIFFNNNSADLSRRYNQLNSDFKNSFELKSLHNKGLFEIYSNILNIIGFRMKENKSATITLTGCNANIGEELENLQLSENRAKTIKNYLVNVWEVESDRIQILAKNLPDKSSNTDSTDGLEENRRVEIFSDNPKILEPIMTYDTILTSTPKIIRFKKPINVKFGEAFWNIKISQNQKLMNEFTGDGKKVKDLDWNVMNEIKKLDINHSIITDIEINDKLIRSTIVEKDTIPLKYTSLQEIEKSNEKKKTIEKFSLILFDFGSNKLSKENEGIINLVKSKIRENSKVQILGYSDRIGNDQFNLKLSQSRAKAVASQFSHVKNLISNGFGESNLLYNNDLPEGRFYCRTVEIIVENEEE